MTATVKADPFTRAMAGKNEGAKAAAKSEHFRTPYQGG
jgi:hypothetical protein